MRADDDDDICYEIFSIILLKYFPGERTGRLLLFPRGGCAGLVPGQPAHHGGGEAEGQLRPTPGEAFLSLIELLHYWALIGGELDSDEIFSRPPPSGPARSRQCRLSSPSWGGTSVITAPLVRPPTLIMISTRRRITSSTLNFSTR